jgi:hypothetical protein
MGGVVAVGRTGTTAEEGDQQASKPGRRKSSLRAKYASAAPVPETETAQRWRDANREGSEKLSVRYSTCKIWYAGLGALQGVVNHLP